MRAGLYYIYIVAKNSFEQWKIVIFQMFNHIVFLLFSLYLYSYVYELLPSLHDKLPYSNAIWRMSIYFVVFWLSLRSLEKTFRDDIKSGNIEIYLLRPLSYTWQKVLQQIGQGLIPFLSALLLSVIVDYFLVGLPVMHMPVWTWILALVAIFILSQILTVFIYVLCGLTGFWLDDSEPIYFVVSKLIMIFGGAWVPVAFFPKTLQLIAEYSPFGASLGLSFAMYPNFAEHFGVLVLNICFWIIATAVLVWIVSERGMRNLRING